MASSSSLVAALTTTPAPHHGGGDSHHHGSPFSYDASMVTCPQAGWNGLTFPSTTIIMAALACFSLVLAILTITCMHGVPSLSHRTCCTFMRRRSVLPVTHNIWWFAFWSITAFTHGYDAVVVSVLSDDNDVTHTRWARLAYRGLVGLTSIALTVTLNHHRQHRHRNASDEDMEPLIRRQVFVLNVCTIALYGVYLVAELLTAAVVGDGHKAEKDFFWCFVASVVLINVPVFYNSWWIAVHKGDVRPTSVARALLGIGVVFRLFFMWPSDLWNGEIIPEHTLWAHPCPIGGVASAYDVVLLLAFGVYTCLFAFSWMEYRRNRLLHIDHLLVQLGHTVDDIHSTNSSMGYGTMGNSSHGVQLNAVE